ncbi:hypothetical protein EU556_01645 [Hymenobacter fodinae]|uniref:Curli assembly protein CsgC n=2 Tax=Hymenobacter fodinae TaxID=2510796 RepID=A0A4Z0PAH4_9BACT|nr:hypothetical protein EU556_01645 [Hymenobacter fodinae]
MISETAAYRYELYLLRRGPGGQSANNQQGRFELGPGQTTTLSEVRLNFDERTSVVGQLRILDAAGHLVAQDSIRHTATHP